MPLETIFIRIPICTCRARESDIIHCPLHESAEKLYEACLYAQTAIERGVAYWPKDHLSGQALKRIIQALMSVRASDVYQKIRGNTEINPQGETNE